MANELDSLLNTLMRYGINEQRREERIARQKRLREERLARQDRKEQERIARAREQKDKDRASKFMTAKIEQMMRGVQSGRISLEQLNDKIKEMKQDSKDIFRGRAREQFSDRLDSFMETAEFMNRNRQLFNKKRDKIQELQESIRKSKDNNKIDYSGTKERVRNILDEMKTLSAQQQKALVKQGSQAISLITSKQIADDTLDKLKEAKETLPPGSPLASLYDQMKANYDNGYYKPIVEFSNSKQAKRLGYATSNAKYYSKDGFTQPELNAQREIDYSVLYGNKAPSPNQTREQIMKQRKAPLQRLSRAKKDVENLTYSNVANKIGAFSDDNEGIREKLKNEYKPVFDAAQKAFADMPAVDNIIQGSQQDVEANLSKYQADLISGVREAAIGFLKQHPRMLMNSDLTTHEKVKVLSTLTGDSITQAEDFLTGDMKKEIVKMYNQNSPKGERVSNYNEWASKPDAQERLQLAKGNQYYNRLISTTDSFRKILGDREDTYEASANRYAIKMFGSLKNALKGMQNFNTNLGYNQPVNESAFKIEKVDRAKESGGNPFAKKGVSETDIRDYMYGMMQGTNMPPQNKINDLMQTVSNSKTQDKKQTSEKTAKFLSDYFLDNDEEEQDSLLGLTGYIDNVK